MARKVVTIWPQDSDVRYLGKLPYRWNLAKSLKDVWNPDEPRLFPPKQFGVGWGLNLFVLWRAFDKTRKRTRR